MLTTRHVKAKGMPKRVDCMRTVFLVSRKSLMLMWVMDVALSFAFSSVFLARDMLALAYLRYAGREMAEASW